MCQVGISHCNEPVQKISSVDTSAPKGMANLPRWPLAGQAGGARLQVSLECLQSAEIVAPVNVSAY